MKNGKLKKILYAFLWILPFVLGTIGYYIEQESLIDALYDAFALYAVNPVSDANSWIIILAKWGAPLVLASGLLLAVQGILKRLKNYFTSLHKNATAVYSDNAYGEILAERLKHGILVTNGKPYDVRDHILLYTEDMDNLNFYQKHQEVLKKKKVFMQLNDIDSFLLRESRIHFFHRNELIARKYWQEHHLLPYFDSGVDVIRVGIVGFASLGQQLLSYGLLNNIYDLNQQIEYHIWGDSNLYEHMQETLQLMNRDKIIYHGAQWEQDVQQFAAMQRIIVTEEGQLELLQTLLYLCGETDIHYYNPGEAVLEEIYQKKFVSFGDYADVLTEENIKGDQLYRAAKELNYKYACMYGGVSGIPAKKEQEMEEQWEQLDGFTKGSNIASADYHQIRRMIMRRAQENKRELTSDMLGRMEHIRWCRYHYLNHWCYGVPENGKNKDASHRIHVCLVPFDELTKEDQGKDYEAVKVLLELMPV